MRKKEKLIDGLVSFKRKEEIKKQEMQNFWRWLLIWTKTRGAWMDVIGLTVYISR